MRIKVAIVDDNASVCRAVCRLLGQWNMDAESFSSGFEFIDSLKRSMPHCVVLDLRMPQMGGREVLAKLRKMQTDIRVIVVSADEDAAIFPFEDSSAPVSLAKPFDEKNLLAAIARMTREVRLTERKSPS